MSTAAVCDAALAVFVSLSVSISLPVSVSGSVSVTLAVSVSELKCCCVNLLACAFFRCCPVSMCVFSMLVRHPARPACPRAFRPPALVCVQGTQPARPRSVPVPARQPGSAHVPRVRRASFKPRPCTRQFIIWTAVRARGPTPRLPARTATAPSGRTRF